MNKPTHPPRIGQHWEIHGGTYAGTTITRASEPEYHIVVIDAAAQNLGFIEATAWAMTEHQACVPTCREMAIIAGNVPALFERTFYWSGETCNKGEGWAWGREFLNGGAVSMPMNHPGRVRAIRRIQVGYTLPARDPARKTTEQGLFRKFSVQRLDGKDAPGCKHHDCRLFVLDLDHDPYAVPALQAYAAACAPKYPELAYDITAHINSTKGATDMPTALLGIELNGHQLKTALGMIDNGLVKDPIDGAVIIRHWPAREDMPAGLYAYDSEYQEEGCQFLAPALDVLDENTEN